MLHLLSNADSHLKIGIVSRSIPKSSTTLLVSFPSAAQWTERFNSQFPWYLWIHLIFISNKSTKFSTINVLKNLSVFYFILFYFTEI